LGRIFGDGDGFEDGAVVVLFPIKSLLVAAMLVLLAAATRTWSVTGDSLASHFPFSFLEP
jgi:hypothetical protein